MAARRALPRNIATLATRASIPRIASLSSRMSTPAGANKVAARRLHATAQHLRPATATATSTVDSYPTNHDQIEKPIDTQNFLDNTFVSSKATQWIELHDPATNNLVTRVPQSTDEELTAAVDSAEKAFKTWRETSVLHRQQIMFKYTALIRENWDRLAASITIEQGKTFADAKGDVLRGLQVAETACGITTQLTGEVLEVAKDMETRSYREPLGVVAAICPFSKLQHTYSRRNVTNLIFRLSRHDSPLVYPNCDCHRQHSGYQALGAGPWCVHDPSRAR
jgi:malonate-semialdehyde dehydrogenase (acetylating)/methylmalonate-semialdehyde dehydrogenase